MLEFNIDTSNKKYQQNCNSQQKFKTSSKSCFSFV